MTAPMASPSCYGRPLPPPQRCWSVRASASAPQGGASVLTFYQPGLHVVSDCTGKERCRASESSGGGDYFHYFTLLPAAAGESIIYNVLQDERRLAAALDLMCSTDVCSTTGE